LIGIELFFHPACETGLLIASTILAGLAAAHGYWHRHGRTHTVLLFSAGLVSVWAGHLLVEGFAEILLTALGGLTTAAAHFVNRALPRRVCC
jgi:hypothetical protein